MPREGIGGSGLGLAGSAMPVKNLPTSAKGIRRGSHGSWARRPFSATGAPNLGHVILIVTCPHSGSIM